MSQEKWKEVNPEAALDYLLPDGLVENCKVELENTVIIGTNKGVYLSHLSSLSTKKPIAKVVGLTELSIVSLKIDRKDKTKIFAVTGEGRVFEAKIYVLTGMR